MFAKLNKLLTESRFALIIFKLHSKQYIKVIKSYVAHNNFSFLFFFFRRPRGSQHSPRVCTARPTAASAIPAKVNRFRQTSGNRFQFLKKSKKTERWTVDKVPTFCAFDLLSRFKESRSTLRRCVNRFRRQQKATTKKTTRVEPSRTSRDTFRRIGPKPEKLRLL